MIPLTHWLLWLIALVGDPQSPTPPAARVSGVVVDQADRPIDRALVSLADTTRGYLRTQIADDAGQFVFEQVPDGRYHVLASKVHHEPSAFGMRTPDDVPVILSIVGGRAIDAVRIRLPRAATRPDEGVSPSDVPPTPPRPQPLVAPGRLAVTLTGPARYSRWTDVDVEALDPGQRYYPRRIQFDEASRTFLSEPLLPGRYKVEARASIDERAGIILPHYGSTVADVLSDATISTAVTMAPGRTVSGRLIYQGDEQRRPPSGAFRVTLERAERNAGSIEGDLFDEQGPNGDFTIRGVPPGRYRPVLRQTGTGPAVTTVLLDSAMLDGRDTLDLPLEVTTTDLTGLVITIRDVGGSIHAQVPGTAHCECTVVLFPAAPEDWSPDGRRIRADKPDTDGNVIIDALPHGDYLIVAVRDLAPGAWRDAAVLRPLLPAATPARIEGATPVRVALRVFTRGVEGVKEYLSSHEAWRP